MKKLIEKLNAFTEEIQEKLKEPGLSKDQQMWMEESIESIGEAVELLGYVEEEMKVKR